LDRSVSSVPTLSVNCDWQAFMETNVCGPLQAADSRSSAAETAVRFFAARIGHPSSCCEKPASVRIAGHPGGAVAQL
jgi:hypothetical protein